MEPRLPTLKEELDRKVLDAVEAILWRLESKQINQAQASEAANALFTATAGLIDREVLNVMCAIRDHDETEYVEREVLTKPGAMGTGVTIIERPVGAAVVRLMSKLGHDGSFGVNKIYRFDDAQHPAEAAFDAKTALLNRMKTLGWSPLCP
ncbi:hypothetical protein PHAMO_80155 [Magnetospirillum molischianum DSM 120]|uniref:Uncharacterized protein n=2 Tax=Magnetospirillum molischianum TaxID=1083 RepID=H8FYC6_MAGML|nr:hypothetical protein PHAMO_80155 [Magnetospirillum molischianum DSM 120]